MWYGVFIIIPSEAFISWLIDQIAYVMNLMMMLAVCGDDHFF